MWVARFKLKDDRDIYSPLCVRHKVELFATPHAQYVKHKKIHLIVGATLSGGDRQKKKFVEELKNDPRVALVEQHREFIIVHATHPISRETEAEIRMFYNSQYLHLRPVQIAKDGWEYWDVACLDRAELNKLIRVAIATYHGKLFSLREEKIRSIASVHATPSLTEKQLAALKIAFAEGYYTYPRSLTLPNLARITKRSYATFQEHLRKGEAKIIEHFLKYR